MELDNLETIHELDREYMLKHINDLPSQLAGAWELGLGLPLPEYPSFQHVVIAGMGGSAIGGDLVAAYASQSSHVPITVLRDYTLPKWKDILVICSSHSGNTEETLAVFDQAVAENLPNLVITTGGKLAEKAGQAGAGLWIFEDDFQPRAAVGFSFGMLLAALARLGVFNLASAAQDIDAAVQAMQEQKADLLPEIPSAINPAKRMAGQFIGRSVVLFGSGFLQPVARRWKTQINEIAKAQASFEFLPEANHNTLQGIFFPEDPPSKSLAFFITSKHNHPRNKLREEFTRKMFMLEGITTDFFRAPGRSVLDSMWTALHFGDYLSFYLAIAYGADPTPVPMLQDLKQKLAGAS
jgi:glucose/mannose-6-phosphate isomerase